MKQQPDPETVFVVFVSERGGEYRTVQFTRRAHNAIIAQLDAEAEYKARGWADPLVIVREEK